MQLEEVVFGIADLLDRCTVVGVVPFIFSREGGCDVLQSTVKPLLDFKDKRIESYILWIKQIFDGNGVRPLTAHI